MSNGDISFLGSFCPSTDVTAYLVRAGSDPNDFQTDPDISVV